MRNNLNIIGKQSHRRGLECFYYFKNSLYLYLLKCMEILEFSTNLYENGLDLKIHFIK